MQHTGYIDIIKQPKTGYKIYIYICMDVRVCVCVFVYVCVLSVQVVQVALGWIVSFLG